MDRLDEIAANMSLKRGTFSRSKRPILEADTLRGPTQEPSTTETCGESSDATSVLSSTVRDLILELQDMERGNPRGSDKHDEVMRQFYSNICRGFPPSLPARYMHLIDVDAYMSSRDPAVKYASPRLCDAVATVLFKTNPKCLEDFLNTDIQVFEWRRSPSCIMIHREGFDVTVSVQASF
jgi:hypothetical protein